MLRDIIMIVVPVIGGLTCIYVLARVTVCGVEMRRDRV